MLSAPGDRLKTPRDRSHVPPPDGTLNQKKIRDHHRCPDRLRELGICVFFLAHVFCCKFSGASELPQFRPNRRLHESNPAVDDFNTRCLSELQDLTWRHGAARGRVLGRRQSAEHTDCQVYLTKRYMLSIIIKHEHAHADGADQGQRMVAVRACAPRGCESSGCVALVPIGRGVGQEQALSQRE